MRLLLKEEIVDIRKPYLTFSSANTFTLATGNTTANWDGTLEYSTDTTTWTTWDGTSISSSSDGVLYLRGTGNTYITTRYTHRFVLTGTNISCEGNIENLLDYATVQQGNHPVMANYCYFNLFADCTSLASAPTLPATSLAVYGYSQMFMGCASLVTAPTLPAITLTNYCYQGMFSGCTSLVTAPELPATELSIQCYAQMFNDCTSLVNAPELPATELEASCYYEMFMGCTSLINAPELPAEIAVRYCYYKMFNDCTSLTTAPELPATELYDCCYNQMFTGCTSLVNAPELPAGTLVYGCYNGMFAECSALESVTMLATDVSADYAIGNWLYTAGTSATNPTLTVASGMSTDTTILANLPSNWTIQEVS